MLSWRHTCLAFKSCAGASSVSPSPYVLGTSHVSSYPASLFIAKPIASCAPGCGLGDLLVPIFLIRMFMSQAVNTLFLCPVAAFLA